MTRPKIGAKETGELERDHWRTPDYILEAVRNFYLNYYEDNLLEPDEAFKIFDPCPPNPTFNGLEVEWGELNFINPPFSQYKQWATKGLNELSKSEKGNRKMVQVWICNHNHDSSWFKMLLNSVYFTGIVLLEKRVKFIDPKTNKPKGTLYGKCQSLLILENQAEQCVIDRFKNSAFGELGTCLLF
jgi:hypothetical protein